MFNSTHYHFRRKILKFVGAELRATDDSGTEALYVEMKAFKLKEDIRVYQDSTKTDELLAIRARSVLDFGATYDVVDSKSVSKVGALRRKGLRSIARDTWQLLDASDSEIGKVQEDSLALAILRRILDEMVGLGVIPQTFTASVGDQVVAVYKQNRNPLVSKIELDLSGNTGGQLDPRLAIATAVLLETIENKQ